MILAHGQHAAAHRVEREIGVAAAFDRRDPARRRIAVDQPDRTRHLVAEHHAPVGDEVGTAAIFMDPRGDVERRRRQVGDPAVSTAADQHRAAAFVRPALEPIERALVGMEGGQADRLAGDQIRRDR
jgi:hypothetical protein